MSKINPDFKNELNKYGSENFNACYNCGNCTAVCSLSDEENSFPRNMVRACVLGQDSEIQSSLTPWLCYYCGECSETCPKQANPAELMMSLRRYLTSVYDWTGFSGLLFKSKVLSTIAFVVLAIVVLLICAYEEFKTEPIMHFGHLFEMIAIGSVFLFILIPNIIRMWWLTILKPKVKVSLMSYIKASTDLIVHMFTQKRTLGCDDNQLRWFEHFILVAGYLTLLFTTVFLNWFYTENIYIILLGYAESAVVFIVTFHFVLSRLNKKKEITKFSRPSDWLFVIWLFLMGFTAFIVRVFIDLYLIESNLWVFIIHLVVIVQWALIIVPFGKWTHFLYRSFAIYFAKLKEPVKK